MVSAFVQRTHVPDRTRADVPVLYPNGHEVLLQQRIPVHPGLQPPMAQVESSYEGAPGMGTGTSPG